MLDMTGEDETENGTEDATDSVGDRGRRGTGFATIGAGERERTGVEAGVWIGSDGLRLLCGRYVGGVTLGLPSWGVSSSSRSRRNRKSRPYSSRS
jgi:hypothetical protein